MRFLVVSVLSLLATRSCAYAAAISGYPYRGELLAFSPARGEIPVVNAISPGYVRFVDQQSVPQFIGYKQADAVQGRRISKDEYLNQLVKGSLNKGEAEMAKLREEHFRLWSIDQYDKYRLETERLKAAGQEPSAELLAKIRTLEALIIAARSGEKLDNTETQQIRNDHLRVWNEARLAVSQPDSGKAQQQSAVAEPAIKPTIYLRFQNVDLAKDKPMHTVVLGETAEQKKAREEHLRIYQEQLQRVQQLQAEAVKLSESSAHLTKEARAEQAVHQEAHQAEQQGEKIIEHLSYLKETPEVQHAKAEHLRLWNEAKLRAEKEGYKYENKQYESEQSLTEGQYDTKKDAYKPEKSISDEKLSQKEPQSYNLEKQSNKYEDGQKSTYGQQFVDKYEEQKTDSNLQTPVPVQDTPEVQRARAEHLKILEELKKKSEFITDNQGATKTIAEPAVQHPPSTQALQPLQTHASKDQLGTTKSISDSQSQPHAFAAVQDTAEVQRAREEHLKLLKEAHIKAQQQHTQSSEIVVEPKPTLYAAAEIDRNADDEEVRLRILEAKQRDAEILAEAERIKKEERLQAEELVRLQQEEQRRQEQERIDQAKENKEAEHYAEKPQLAAPEQPKETPEQLSKTQIQTGGEAAVTYDIREKESYAENPYLLRFATPAASQIGGAPIATTAYYIGAQSPALQQYSYANPGYYYLRDASDSYIKLDNPYLLHYITSKQGATADAISLATLNQVQKIEQPIAAAYAEKPITAPIIPIAPIATGAPLAPLSPAAPILPIAPTASSAATMKINYGNDLGLAALQQATREHFRAHEIALEQLRLANQKNPTQKDC